MKKKMLAAGIIGIILIFFGGWYFLFCHLGIGPAFPFLPGKEAKVEDMNMENMAGNQLMSLTETEEEAKAIAQQYGIELVSFSDGVATYKTDEDPNEVIARGQKNGYPQIYLNYVRAID